MIINLPIGIVGSNCIIIYDTKSHIGAVVDPGILNADPVNDVITEHNINIAYILNTHAHFDHTVGNGLLHHPPVKIAIHSADREMLLAGDVAAFFGLDYPSSPEPDMVLQDKDIIQLGETDIQVIHTPGHSPGSVSFYIEKENTVLTGDTLFQGSVGRTDLPGGNEQTLLHSLKTYLNLPVDTVVLPGHGPASTIREEKRSNTWLRYILR